MTNTRNTTARPATQDNHAKETVYDGTQYRVAASRANSPSLAAMA